MPLPVMSDWEIKKKRSDSFEHAVGTILTGGLINLVPGETYTVENPETGETREVVADDEEELGEKISRGEFND